MGSLKDYNIKHIVSRYPIDARFHWTPSEFNELINNQGYRAWIDKSHRCVCIDPATGQALSTCKNCMGKGFFFTDRYDTMVIAQGMNGSKNFNKWSEENKGNARITFKNTERIAFMDRVVINQIEGLFSEIVKTYLYDGECICYPTYEPILIEEMYKFNGPDKQLIRMTEDDYMVDGNRITFKEDVKQVSMRYKYHPVYHVIEMVRENMKVRNYTFCGHIGPEHLTQMPILAICRKAHYLWDNTTFDDTKIYND